MCVCVCVCVCVNHLTIKDDLRGVESLGLSDSSMPSHTSSTLGVTGSMYLVRSQLITLSHTRRDRTQPSKCGQPLKHTREKANINAKAAKLSLIAKTVKSYKATYA